MIGSSRQSYAGRWNLPSLSRGPRACNHRPAHAWMRIMTEKRCSRCGLMLPAERFYADPRMRSGLSSNCKACYYERYKKWAAANRDHVNEYCRVRRQKYPEVRSLHNERCRRYHAAHPPRAYTDEARESCRRYRLKHPDKCRQMSAARRAKLASAVVPDTLPAIKAFYHWAQTARHVKCYLCGKPVKKHDRHVDHVTPLHLGGLHVPQNLCVMHGSCNDRKSYKPPQAVGLLF